MRQKKVRRFSKIFIVAVSMLLPVCVFYLLSKLPSVYEAALVLKNALSSGVLKIEILGTLKILFTPVLSFIFSKEMVALYVISVGAVILLENKNPDRTIAWLLALFVFPIIGLLLYMIVGPKFQVTRRLLLRKIPKKHVHKDALKPSALPLPWSLTAELLHKSNRAPLCYDDIKVLTDGDETFGAIFAALKSAKKIIYGEYFSISDDGLGNEFRMILEAKAREGIAVYLIYDAVGSHALGRKYLNSLKNAGVNAYSFNSVSFPMLRREYNYRNHRKIVVVDGEVGFLGGLNVGDMYMGKHEDMGHWRDTHLQIRGGGVQSLTEIFLRDWSFCASCPAPILPDFGGQKGQNVQKVQKNGAIMQIATSGPDSPWESILQGYFSLITRAKRRIWITTPYLIPSADISSALKIAALSGVDVRIVIPGKADHIMVFWASRGNIADLLRSGIRIYMYQDGFIHAKIMSVDGEAASVGTANMDLRSLQINYEVQAFIYDTQVTKRLEDDFVRDMKKSKEIKLGEWEKRPPADKIKEAVFRLLSPQL